MTEPSALTNFWYDQGVAFSILILLLGFFIRSVWPVITKWLEAQQESARQTQAKTIELIEQQQQAFRSQVDFNHQVHILLSGIETRLKALETSSLDQTESWTPLLQRVGTVLDQLERRSKDV